MLPIVARRTLSVTPLTYIFTSQSSLMPAKNSLECSASKPAIAYDYYYLKEEITL